MASRFAPAPHRNGCFSEQKPGPQYDVSRCPTGSGQSWPQWDQIKARTPVGRLVEGVVVARQSFGAFIDLDGALALMELPALPGADALPAFRYHDDPLNSGAITASEVACRCCGEHRGFVYTGPVFHAGAEELDGHLCPWCIADGSAAKKFDAEFVPIDGEVVAISPRAQEELEKRTVSFTGWQEVVWLAHCNDAMAFVAMADAARLHPHTDAVRSLREQFDSWTDAQFEEFLGWLTIDGSPTAYLFRCLHCGTHRANADFD